MASKKNQKKKANYNLSRFQNSIAFKVIIILLVALMIVTPMIGFFMSL